MKSSSLIHIVHNLKIWIMVSDVLLPGPEVIKSFMLNSAEHEIFLPINDKMLTIVGILTFMSRKNSIPGSTEPGES